MHFLQLQLQVYRLAVNGGLEKKSSCRKWMGTIIYTLCKEVKEQAEAFANPNSPFDLDCSFLNDPLFVEHRHTYREPTNALGTNSVDSQPRALLVPSVSALTFVYLP